MGGDRIDSNGLGNGFLSSLSFFSCEENLPARWAEIWVGGFFFHVPGGLFLLSLGCGMSGGVWWKTWGAGEMD
jgi:hypothetical protein